MKRHCRKGQGTQNPALSAEVVLEGWGSGETRQLDKWLAALAGQLGLMGTLRQVRKYPLGLASGVPMGCAYTESR